jgi:hypothetical protein
MEVLASGSCRRRRIFHFTSKYAGARGLVALFLGAKKRPDGLQEIFYFGDFSGGKLLTCCNYTTGQAVCATYFLKNQNISAFAPFAAPARRKGPPILRFSGANRPENGSRPPPFDLNRALD